MISNKDLYVFFYFMLLSFQLIFFSIQFKVMQQLVHQTTNHMQKKKKLVEDNGIRIHI